MAWAWRDEFVRSHDQSILQIQLPRNIVKSLDSPLKPFAKAPTTQGTVYGCVTD